jgi:predicted TIM-barrel fold metal-dependent hydrolase
MTETSPTLEEARRLLEGLRVIDTDTHLSEPKDLWSSRAPAGWRERLPHVKRVDGREMWFVDRDVPLQPAIPVSVVRRDRSKARGTEFFSLPYEAVHEASYDTKARLALMDELGIHAQIVYPNLAGFGNHRFLAVADAELRKLCATVYNDAMAEIQADSGGRLFPMALVPWWDIDAAVREVERASGLGLRGVVTCSDPDGANLPDLGQPHWDPFWAACGELGMPINFHIAASDTGFSTYGRSSWPSMGLERRLALGSAALFLDNARVIGNLIFSGVPERHPRCRFVSVESGIGWIPFYLEALDHQLVESAPNEGALLTLTPSEYFRRQFYGCFWFETTAPQKLIDDVGVRNVMFETDFPHPTCLYPENREHVFQVLRGWDEGTRRRVLQDNAAELYRIPL